MTRRQAVRLIDELRGLALFIEFHHGGADGADAEAHEAALGLGLDVHVHPAIGRVNALRGGAFTVHPPRPPLMRNMDIVDVTELLLAAPRTCEEELRSGTWATIRHARHVGRPIRMLAP